MADLAKYEHVSPPPLYSTAFLSIVVISARRFKVILRAITYRRRAS